LRRSNRTEIEFIEGPVDITVDPLNLLYFYPTSVASTSPRVKLSSGTALQRPKQRK